MALSKSVVTEDRRLENAVESASDALARHRWHWTIDESNPDRVSLREYARESARDYSTIRAYAQGYATWSDGGRTITLNEAMERVKMGAETEAVTEAIAAARNLSISRTRQDRGTEVRRVREIARERAEKKGTRVEDEARSVAEAIVKVEKAGQEMAAKRKERLGLRFVEMEGKLDSVKRTLVEAVNLAHEIEWGDEETELLQATLANIKALLNLIDVAFAGTADIDWDKELEKLTREG